VRGRYPCRRRSNCVQPYCHRFQHPSEKQPLAGTSFPSPPKSGFSLETARKTLKFSANKKWAVSPLISPPAGVFTATQADKLVCISSIGQNAGNFNVRDGRRGKIELIFAAARGGWPELLQES
jgi:hypothetical protein